MFVEFVAGVTDTVTVCYVVITSMHRASVSTYSQIQGLDTYS